MLLKMAYLVSNTNNESRLKVSQSARAIFELLHTSRPPLAVYEIKEELSYSERTIHYALRQLREYALIEKRANLQDLRESRYLLAAKAQLYQFLV